MQDFQKSECNSKNEYAKDAFRVLKHQSDVS